MRPAVLNRSLLTVKAGNTLLVYDKSDSFSGNNLGRYNSISGINPKPCKKNKKRFNPIKKRLTSLTLVLKFQTLGFRGRSFYTDSLQILISSSPRNRKCYSK
jgi:hypothetical protein